MPVENQKADPFGPGGKTYHVHLCVRGYLRGASKRELAGMFQRTDGSKLSADEAREYLMDCLSQGKEVLPLSSECDGFDYSGKGCPGHAKEQQA